MQLHNISPKTKPKRKRYIGHGGKKGTYSGKGIKGQRSRTGTRIRPQIQDLIKRLPKMRGYDRISVRAKKETATININDLQNHFQSGEVVNRENLLAKGLISARIKRFKILNKGKITKPLTIEKIPASKAAIEAIIKAGGKYV